MYILSTSVFIKLQKLQKQVQDRFAIANEVAEEVCSSMQTVRSFANEEGEMKRYDSKLRDVYKVQFKQAAAYSGFIWSTQVCKSLRHDNGTD